jgi:hypothetical protein
MGNKARGPRAGPRATGLCSACVLCAVGRGWQLAIAGSARVGTGSARGHPGYPCSSGACSVRRLLGVRLSERSVSRAAQAGMRVMKQPNGLSRAVQACQMQMPRASSCTVASHPMLHEDG